MESSGWIQGRLLRRYKRFLADVRLADGSEVTVHCPNTGAMTGCAEPGSRVWLRDTANPRRKYPYSWELVETACGSMACIHSAGANAMVVEALDEGRLPELAGYTLRRREAPIGVDGSRVDILLSDGVRPDCYVEIKSVTLHLDGGLGVFPDAVSVRATRHLQELMQVASQKRRAVLLFVAQHTGITHVAPADAIDPVYAATLRDAMDAGVEVMAYGATVAPGQVRLANRLPVLSRADAR